MKKIIAYKGFNEDWTCRGYQYEVGGSYTHAGEIELCRNGFHSCTYPLDVFTYYAPATSRYAIVEASVDATRQCDDSKIASSYLTVKKEVKLHQLVQYAVDWIMASIDECACEGEDRSAATNTGDQSSATNTGFWSAATNTGDQSAATNTGDWSAATNTGHQSAATNTGDWSAATNTGNRSAATNTGDWSAATNTGHQSAATNTGDWSAATNTGHQSAATNTGDWSASTNTGNWSAATNTGDQSAATNTGHRSAATNTGYLGSARVDGNDSIAIAAGMRSKAKASMGSAIVLCYRGGNGELLHIRAAIAGRDVEPDTWYTLNELGEFVSVTDDAEAESA
ncbi:hypothetical protein Q2E61_09365 [Microbulbifer thermotolerans]|uniref:DUF7666 domain-containing protein n=1 Tax=Microbulbifer thermotolerans TaxID=252514 RepID=UPI002673EB47|nr:hypothetical protein [Microbulbifer thermotolerans]WKT59135.1 hypothetical protein Q2E61_09365 [Microbulbifer thermotolerans]